MNDISAEVGSISIADMTRHQTEISNSYFSLLSLIKKFIDDSSRKKSYVVFITLIKSGYEVQDVADVMKKYINDGFEVTKLECVNKYYITISWLGDYSVPTAAIDRVIGK